MTRDRSTRTLLVLLLLASCAFHTAVTDCVNSTLFVWNNILETSQDPKDTGDRTLSTSNVSDVSLAGDGSPDAFDVSQYFDVSLSDGTIYLDPKQPELTGIVDYPNTITLGKGIVTATCQDNTTGSFPVQVVIKDDNTATPQLSESSYNVTVVENYPLNLAVQGLVLSATDYDSDATNYAITFALENDFGTFSLTPAQQTSSWPATYTTQLTLTQGLDWSQQSEYRLTVTATDPGGRKNSSDVTITIRDVDNHPPEFPYTGYTAEALDRTAVGPLTVLPANIKATDKDIGGPLKYFLLDLPHASWAQYFSLNEDTAALALSQVIPDDVTTPSEITLIIETRETKEAKFVSRVPLVVSLTPQEGVLNTTGYIVGLAILGCLALVLLVTTAVLYRKSKRPAPPPPQTSSSTNDQESGYKKRGDTGYDLSSSKPPEKTTGLTSASSGYDNHGFKDDQPASPTSFSVESEKRHAPPPPDSSLYTPLHTAQPTGSADDDARPIGARPDDVTASAPPMGDEDTPARPIGEGDAPPEEPRPDYAAKSVGFKDTVMCVTPVETVEAAEDEDDDEEHEEEKDEDDEKEGAADGEDKKAGNAESDEDEEDDML